MTPARPRAVLVAAAVGVVTAIGAAGGEARGVHAIAQTADAGAPPATCVVHSLPAFTAQGEFATTGTVADVVEVECDPESYGTRSKMRITDEQLWLRCERGVTWYVPNSPTEGFRKETGSGITLELDPDGNATVALLAGPNCSPGETLLTAHMQSQPFESFATSFSVLPPRLSPLGLSALPASQVQDAYSSAFATIVQAEFPGISEQTMRIGSEELYHRCHVAPHLRWIESDGKEITEVAEVTGVPLDNDGNGFVIVIGDASCASGRSLIEADLEESPFTTLTASFTTLPPQPTAEPAFTIEKRQELEGSGTGLTTATLQAALGQTVDYQITVRNSGRVPETLSALTDAHCDPGTLVGGPGSNALAPAEATTYTCSHLLTAVGPYANEATITASTAGGNPLTGTSNQVVVEVPPKPAFTIEKLERLAGAGGPFTTGPLTAVSGQTVEYQLAATNTGNEPLALSGFSDEHCDPGTLAGGPGEVPLAVGARTVYTCTRLLTGPGAYANQASVTATPPGGSPVTQRSNIVEASVPSSLSPAHASFTIEKLQRLAQLPGNYTSQLLAGVPKGDTLAYEVVVRNTGTVALAFSAFTDAHCDPGTIAGGAGAAAVAPGSAVTYTCSHVMRGEKRYVNEATITGTAPGQPAITQVSNQVEAREAVLACKTTTLKLRGASGPKRGPFTAQVIVAGIGRVTLYLDGRKLKVLTAAQAKASRLEVKIDPRRLAYGGHRVTARASANPCGAKPASQVFVFEHLKPFRPTG
jgi:hypothetical protein